MRRHVKLTLQAMRLIKVDFVRLFQRPATSGSTRMASAARSEPGTDSVLSTREAADLVGVSRPYIVAPIEAGDIPLHQQVGNQRRVLKSAVLAWHLLSKAIRTARVVAFEDLGMEAIHEFESRDFPVTVMLDASGRATHACINADSTLPSDWFAPIQGVQSDRTRSSPSTTQAPSLDALVRQSHGVRERSTSAGR